MINNPIYKNYANQIAELFCSEQSNKNICKASVSTRLIEYLDDYTFPEFLNRLSIGGRFFITVLEAFQNKGFRIVIVDLITGQRETAWWDVIWNYPYLGKLPGVLNNHHFEIISANKTFNEENKSNYRITWNDLKPGYGIVFVPGSVGGGSSTGGTPTPTGGTPTPGGGSIQIKPEPTDPGQMTPTGSSFDLSGLISNPILLIGIGAAAYFILKK